MCAELISFDSVSRHWQFWMSCSGCAFFICELARMLGDYHRASATPVNISISKQEYRIMIPADLRGWKLFSKLFWSACNVAENLVSEICDTSPYGNFMCGQTLYLLSSLDVAHSLYEAKDFDVVDIKNTLRYRQIDGLDKALHGACVFGSRLLFERIEKVLFNWVWAYRTEFWVLCATSSVCSSPSFTIMGANFIYNWLFPSLRKYEFLW